MNTRHIALKSASPGSVVFTSERIGDETRETFYVRDPDRECRYKANVAVGRFGFIQGDPTSAEPRCIRILKKACRDPGEADGRTPCRTVECATFYPLLFANEVAK